jgi:hypothetical protein
LEDIEKLTNLYKEMNWEKLGGKKAEDIIRAPLENLIIFSKSKSKKAMDEWYPIDRICEILPSVELFD